MSIDVLVPLQDYVRSHVLTAPDSPKPGVIFRDITLPRAKPRLFHVLGEDLLQPCSAVKLKASGPAPVAAVDHVQI